MDNQTRRVLIGWLNLTSSERIDFIDKLNAYVKMSTEAQRDFEISVRTEEIIAMKMAIGPLSDPCPCCGK